MEILTPRKIQELMFQGREEVLPGDGWADITLFSVTEEVPSRLMKRTYRRECRLQIGSSITYKKGGGDTAASDVAHGIHKELYGNVLERLYLLSHKIQTASKDECENITRGLIDDLLGRRG